MFDEEEGKQFKILKSKVENIKIDCEMDEINNKIIVFFIRLKN